MKNMFNIMLVALELLANNNPAGAQVAPTQQIVLTTSTSTVAGSGTTAVTSQAFSPNSLTGFAVAPNFVLTGTAASTGNITFNFQASLDGTTWTTTYPYSFTVAATGTNAVRAFYNFPPNLTGTGATNIPYVRLGQIVNADPGGLTLNSITISKSNR